jgi:hypothetical protein
VGDHLPQGGKVSDRRCPPRTTTLTHDQQLTYARIGAHILIAKLIDRTTLTEEEIVAAVVQAARTK